MENSTNRSLSIKNWAEEDRPREKLLLKGKSTLSDAELIGILLGSGTRTLSAVDVAKIILNEYDNDLNKLARITVKELTKFKGIGEAKAIAIVSALELGRRKKDSERVAKPVIKTSDDAYDYLKPDLLDQVHEEFWIILLKRNNEIIKKVRISIGGISGTVVDAKIIMKHALVEMASSIILAHNHPSGNKKPSQSDIQITKKLKQAGLVMDIPIVDHIIFTDHGFYSFSDESLL
ncbi:MAG: DNA repair protein RadC [Cyclobacteriaceae bacterium]|jgi:DNA repair protein RadC